MIQTEYICKLLINTDLINSELDIFNQVVW